MQQRSQPVFIIVLQMQRLHHIVKTTYIPDLGRLIKVGHFCGKPDY